MAKQKDEPTFVSQAFALIEDHFSQPGSENEYSMKIGDHKLLCKILDQHEKYIDDEIISKTCTQIAEHYNPIMKAIGEVKENQKIIMEAQKIIALDITHIKKDIVEIKERMEVVEKRGELNKAKIEEHEKKITEGFKKITDLENDVKELKDIVEPENLKTIKDDLKRVAPIIRNIWWKFALLLVAFLILVFIIVSYLLSNKHIALMKSNNAKMENKEYYEKPNTRGGHVIQLTKAQQDSIDKANIKKQIEETFPIIQKSMKQNQ
jgi:hypothetical protein